VAEIVDADEFILGHRVSELEHKVAELADWGHAVACASGTGALMLALTAMGIGSGDEVVMPAFAGVPAATAVALTGATPVFADVDIATMTLDPHAAEAAIGPRTRGLLSSHGLRVTESACLMHELARRRGLFLLGDTVVVPNTGSLDRSPELIERSTARAFSLGPDSSFSGCADAGMVVTDDIQLAGACRALRNHGQRQRFVHDYVGFNCRMDEIAAAVLLRRLAMLAAELAARESLASCYADLLRPLAPHVRIPAQDVRASATQGYIVLASRRDELRDFLSEEGVAVPPCPAVPLYLEPAFARFGCKPDEFPGAELLVRECLALPLHEGLQSADVRHVAGKMAGFYQRDGA
jgi:dTDP-4-amino-4,6-dideoxygalactose transaminase